MEKFTLMQHKINNKVIEEQIQTQTDAIFAAVNIKDTLIHD